MEPKSKDELPKGRGTFWPDDENQAPTSLLVLPRSKKYAGQWFYVHQDVDTGVTLMEQAKYEKPLTQTEYRVRDMLLGSMGLGNWAIVNQAEIARQIRVDRAKVSHAIKRLIELGIVIQGEKIGRNSQYMISPAFCFKGSMSEGQKLVKEAEKHHKAKVIPFKAREPEQGSLLE
jgi:Uncharacterized membrane-associated protein/domain